MIPFHPTATSNPRQLRWVIAPGYLPPAGTVRQAPGRLGALLERGTIEKMLVCGADVLITLSVGNSWRHIGHQIREALADALLDPDGWQVDSEVRDPGRLAEIANDILAGPIGSLAESHGGSIELASVTGTNVTVRMSGACHGCPAATSTLHDKLQHELRRRVGEQVTVYCETRSTPLTLGKRLLSLMVR